MNDMLEAIEKIERYIDSLSFEEFEGNPMVVDAVVRNLEVIGEAAKHIPEELRTKGGSINWKQVVGFRNVAIHAYFAVDVEIVWTVATQGLVQLKQVIAQIANELEGGISQEG